ncbi:MAG: NAD(+) diphosphatase [Actinomycetota bacterium]|nr:NAD(+) diphosphatase [Actinomycetota bacterium]MDQ2959351.1 NAD(+) diphosphatase [Actinomycetota bacterium]
MPRPSQDPWAIPDVPLLGRSAHDRLAQRRTDQAWLDRAWQQPDSKVLLVSPAGTVAIQGHADEPDLILLEPGQVRAEGVRVLLGAAGGLTYFALLASEPVPDEGWLGLREVGALLTDLDVGLLTSAVALRAWHHRHPRCPQCGAATDVAQAGWTRVCPVDSSEHFPRTDPAVIMLVHDGAGRCVLARGPQWGAGRMSVLAGFVEAGESAEAAVAREVGEEVGIAIRDIRYAGSQPHPFPASLMLGYTALLDGDPTLHIDGDEIIEAAWFTREEVRRTADWGADLDPAEVGLRALPSTMSIARQLINGWLASSD